MTSEPPLGTGTMGTRGAGGSVNEGVVVAGKGSAGGGPSGGGSTGGGAPRPGSKSTIAVAGTALASPTETQGLTSPALSKSGRTKDTLGYRTALLIRH